MTNGSLDAVAMERVTCGALVTDLKRVLEFNSLTVFIILDCWDGSLFKRNDCITVYYYNVCYDDLLDDDDDGLCTTFST